MVWKTPEFKVGIFVFVVFVLVGVLSLKISHRPEALLGNNSHWFELDDSTGLVPNSVVRMAGVKVGVVEKISLIEDKGTARVDILISGKVKLTTSSGVEIASKGILGDKHVQLVMGNVSDPVLPDGSQLKVLASGSSLNRFIDQVGSSLESLNTVIKSFESAVGEGSTQTSLGRIFRNIETVTSNLVQVTETNKEKLREIVDNFGEVTRGLKLLLNEETGEELRERYDRLVRGLSDISDTLSNLNDITTKVNEGEGTLGRLINDESTVNEVNELISKVNTVMSDFSRYETLMDLKGSYGVTSERFLKEFNIIFRPGLDRQYEIGIQSDPLGVRTTTETFRDGSDGSFQETEVKYHKEQVKFRLLYGRRYYDLVVKGGVIDSFGGLGFDYYLFGDRIKLSSEFYNFKEPNYRHFVQVHIIQGFYLTGGIHLLQGLQRREGYMGIGIILDNQDLKLLATKAPF